MHRSTNDGLGQAKGTTLPGCRRRFRPSASRLKSLLREHGAITRRGGASGAWGLVNLPCWMLRSWHRAQGALLHQASDSLAVALGDAGLVAVVEVAYLPVAAHHHVADERGVAGEQQGVEEGVLAAGGEQG